MTLRTTRARGNRHWPWLAGLLLLVGIGEPASAAWQTPGAVKQVKKNAGAVDFTTTSGALIRISFLGDDVVRVRMNPHGGFAQDFSYALSDASHAAVEIVGDADQRAASMDLHTRSESSAHVIVQLRPTFLLRITDAQGRIVVADDPVRPMAFDAASGAVEVSKLRRSHELYYGFGEKALPLSRHQQYLTMWNTDTPKYAPGLDPLYQDIPFFIALSDGSSYGVFFDNTWRSYFDMGKTDPVRYTFGAANGELNYYVFTGGKERSPANVLRDYTQLTGRSGLPPLWSLGYQQSRYSYTPAARVREIAQTFRAKKIPADVIYLDIDYMQDYRIFTWSKTAFPEPQKLVGDLRDQHFHVVTIVDPGIKVDEGYAIYRQGRERGMFVRDAHGDELHAAVWPGECAFPDFTNPAARAWFGSLYADFANTGVSGFWNDMNEPATFAPENAIEPLLVHDPGRTFVVDAQHHGDGQPGDHARYHNVYGMQMARATFEGLRELQPQHRPLVLTRAGYAGVQRYAAVWTGDNIATWEHLALSIPMLTNMSVSGVPFVGADIGGYAGSPSAELYARWLQAAALTPFFRTHAEIHAADREPWSYGDAFEDINRSTIELRYRLLPYLYTLFAQQESSGTPPLRPLWFEYPHDVKALLIDDEYLVGRDLLVAPVVNAGETARRVYFPVGDDWIDWWTGEHHEGGGVAEIPAPLDRLPLFQRAGSSIPIQAVVQDTGAMAGLPLAISVALGADGVGAVYEDAGDGYGYRSGEMRSTQIALHADKLTLRVIGKSRFRHIGAIEFIGLERAPKKVIADGKNASEFGFDAAAHRSRVTLPVGTDVHDVSLVR